nr:hypothetical protein [Gammaproteobacteria bacterium]
MTSASDVTPRRVHGDSHEWRTTRREFTIEFLHGYERRAFGQIVQRAFGAPSVIAAAQRRAERRRAKTPEAARNVVRASDVCRTYRQGRLLRDDHVSSR